MDIERWSQLMDKFEALLTKLSSQPMPDIHVHVNVDNELKGKDGKPPIVSNSMQPYAG